MTLDQLTAEAEKTVAATRRKLPAALRDHAARLPVAYHDWPTDEILGEEFEPDILGMFVGDALDIAPGEGHPVAPHVMLFLENIYDFSEGDLATFREEVRITYLHELGHYFGWDEDDLEARGLD